MQAAYTNQAKVEAYLNRSLTANELVILPGIIQSVSDAIQVYTGRNWVDIEASESEEATAKLYDGQGGKMLYVDDFTELVKVELLDFEGATYVEVTDQDQFILYPLNEDIKESIYLRLYHFPVGSARVRITANFANALPEGVISAATALVAKFISRMGPTTSGFKKESIEGYSYELQSTDDMDMETKAIFMGLDAYVKIQLY